MNELASTAILLVASAFGIIKLFFGVLGWYSQTGADTRHRDYLTRLWDRMDRRSMLRIVQATIARIMRRLGGRSAVTNTAVVTLGVALFTGLFAAYDYAYNIGGAKFYDVNDPSVRITQDDNIQAWTRRVLSDVRPDMDPQLENLGFVTLVRTVFGSLLFLLSLGVTLGILRASLRVRTAVGLFALGLVDVIMALSMSFWSIVPSVVMSRRDEAISWHETGYIFEEAGGDIRRSATLRTDIGEPVAYFELGPADALVGFASTALPACLPTLLHILLVATFLTVKLTPRRVRDTLHDSIYLVVSAEKPVLSQLGTFLGGIAAGLCLLGLLLARFGRIL